MRVREHVWNMAMKRRIERDGEGETGGNDGSDRE